MRRLAGNASDCVWQKAAVDGGDVMEVELMQIGGVDGSKLSKSLVSLVLDDCSFNFPSLSKIKSQSPRIMKNLNVSLNLVMDTGPL